MLVIQQQQKTDMEEVKLQQKNPVDLPAVSDISPSVSVLEKTAIRASSFAGAAIGSSYHSNLLPSSNKNSYHLPTEPRKADSCCWAFTSE